MPVWLESILLGIIQGFTEFLPVSSSGHLELAKWFLGYEATASESLLMTVVLHAATALSTILVFRKDILEILTDLFSSQWNDGKKFSLFVIISMVPAAIIGISLEDWMDQHLTGNIPLVGICLIVTAISLWLADKAKETDKSISSKSALIIGIAQAVAILPGISRSGATIATSVLLGIDRGKAARFSFLMVIPLILGKMAKDILDGDLSNETTPILALTLGFTTAFITGWFACIWMIKLVKSSQLKVFAYYCLAVGLISLISYSFI